MKSITIEIDDIGPVILESSKRSRHLNIYVKPFKCVRVAVPYRISFKEAEKIVHSKISWIKKHLARMNRIEHEHKSILNNSHTINKAEASVKLLNRLNELAKEYNFVYNKLFVRNQKTIWGSCTSKSNINLNMKLIKLPDELIDYVILHELVHTRIKNHRREFWANLNRYVKDAKMLDKQLKKYRIGLF